MDLLHLLWGFLIANVLGYGGGPASIPLMQDQIVGHYHWLTNLQFAKALALANALPGPVSTKIASYVGYVVAGWPGVVMAAIGAVVPSAFAMVVLLRLLHRYRQSQVVKGMTVLVQPVIAVLMIVLTWKVGHDSFKSIGIVQSLILAAVTLLALQKFRIHPALVIIAAFIYGGVVIQ